MEAVYRDASNWQKLERERLIHEHLAELAAADATRYAARRGRIAAGRIAVMGLGFAVVAAFLCAQLSLGIGFGLLVLMAIGPAAMFARWRARNRAVASNREEIASWLESLDLGTLRILSMRGILDHRTRQLESPALAWPLAGLLVTAPLTIHLVVAAFAMGRELDTADFDIWIMASSVITFLPHLALALMARRFAEQTASHDTEHLTSYGWVQGFLALAIATGASLMPGIFLLGIPTVFVLFTGALFVPFSFAGFGALVRRERLAIAREAGELPAPPSPDERASGGIVEPSVDGLPPAWAGTTLRA